MKKIYLLFVFSSAVVFAQNINKEMLTDSLIYYLHIQEQIQKDIGKQYNNTLTTMAERLARSEDDPMCVEPVDSILSIMREIATRPSFKKKLVELYSAYYTESEVSELLQFYKSPTGQKSLSSKDYLYQKAGEISKLFLQNEFARIQHATEAVVAKYKQLQR